MATTLNATVLFRVAYKHVKERTIGDTLDAAVWEPKLTIGPGAGTNQANQQWYTVGTLAAAATVDLDLAGVLTNSFGDTVTLTKIRVLAIHNAGADDGDGGYTTQSGETLKVGAAGTNPITSIFDGSSTSKVVIHSGGQLLLTSPADGLTVTAGSADVLRIENAGTKTIQYRILVQGVQ